MTVGLRSRDDFTRDDTGRSILDDDVLAEPDSQMGCNDARDDVVAASGFRSDDAYRPARVFLRARDVRRKSAERHAAHARDTSSPHVSLGRETWSVYQMTGPDIETAFPTLTASSIASVTASAVRASAPVARLQGWPVAR